MSEPLKDYLPKREKELLEIIDKHRREVAPFEAELAEVRRLRASLAGVPLVPNGIPRGLSSSRSGSPQLNFAAPENPYEKLSMKALSLRALKHHFPRGATAAELLDFFHGAWGRTDVKRESLSPQLSRLRQEGRILFKDRLWILKEKGPEGAASGP
jgi:hypothetical protein